MDRASELRVAERYRRSGDFDRAVAALQALVSEIPHDTGIRRRLADVLIESGNRDSAISELVKIQERLSSAGDILGAIAAGLRVVELDPRFENPLAYIAKVTVDSLRDEQKKREAQTVPVPTLTPLNDIPLLSELTPEELSSVAGAMKRHELEEGSVVFDEGDAGGSLFFVTQGLLEVRADNAKLGVVSAGQCLGEFSFLTGDPRTASVRCLEDSELLELSADRMRGVVGNHRRLREVLFSMYRDRALVNVLPQSPLFEMFPSKDRARLAHDGDLLVLQNQEGHVMCSAPTKMFLYFAKLGLRQRNIPAFDDWRAELEYELLDDVSADMHIAEAQLTLLGAFKSATRSRITEGATQSRAPTTFDFRRPLLSMM